METIKKIYLPGLSSVALLGATGDIAVYGPHVLSYKLTLMFVSLIFGSNMLAITTTNYLEMRKGYDK